MESPQSIKIITNDIRQSDEWAENMKMYGWDFIRTPGGINVGFLHSKLGSFVKIQRPRLLDEKDLEEIENLCKKNRAFFIKIETSYGQNIEVLTKNAYVASPNIMSPASTIYMDLELSEKVLWENISKGARYSIKRAQREGVLTKFYIHPNEDVLKQFYELYKQTGIKKKYGIKSFDDIVKRTRTFGDKSYLVCVYDKEGGLVGSKYYLGYKENVWYIFGGTSDRGRVKSKAGYELMWQSILYLKNEGYKLLDLDGIFDERFPTYLDWWGGFSHFKERFGGRVIQFPVPYVKYLHPLMKLMSKLTPFNV